MQDRETCGGDVKGPNRGQRNPGKYTCYRCGWRWSPRPNSPDPPRACARCRSAYWQSAPVSPRANSPDDPKWQRERESIARRKQKRDLKRLQELAAEYGLEPPPIRNGLAQAPVFHLPNELSRHASISVDTRARFTRPAPTPVAPDTSTDSSEPRLSLSERLARISAAETKIDPPK